MNKLVLFIFVLIIIGQQILCIYQMNNADKITPDLMYKTALHKNGVTK